MTTSGLDAVRRYRELVADNRLEEALDLLSEDLEFTIPTGSTMTRAELEALWSEPQEGYDHLTMEMVATGLHEIGSGCYIGETDQVFRWKETGEISNIEHRAMLYEVEGGKICRMKFFVDPTEAWAEAGAIRR